MKTKRINGPGVKELNHLLKVNRGTEAQVGWFETARYPSGISVAEVAAIQEFGSEANNIPPRPMFRPVIKNEREAWRKLIDAAAKKILNGDWTIENAFEALGLRAAADVRKRITQIKTPPLKPATIAARKSRFANKKVTGNLDKPLVDTKIMLNSLTHAVINK